MKNKKNTDQSQIMNVQSKDLYYLSGLFIIVFTVYILSMPQGLYFGDSGELAATAYSLGIAHPPGYPLYLMTGKLFQILAPIGDIAYRMNLFSVIFASLAICILYKIGRELMLSPWAAFAGAGVAAFSATFWSQATITEVYALSMCFFLLLLYLQLIWVRTQKQYLLIAMALIAGLSMTHHILAATYFPVFIIFSLWVNPALIKDWQLIGKLAMAFILPLSLYLYLPIHSVHNPLNDWGDPETLNAVIAHITAQQFEGLFFKFGFSGVFYQLKIFSVLLFDQYTIPLMLVAIAGLYIVWQQYRKLALLILALMAVNIIYSTSYFITDIEPYYLNTFLILSLPLMYAVQFIGEKLQKFSVSMPVLITIVLPCCLLAIPLFYHFHKLDNSDNHLASDLSLSVLNSLEKDSVLFVGDDDLLFRLNYLKVVAKIRPDVQIYDLRQNIFFIPAVLEKGKENVSMADLYNYSLDLLNKNKNVYFTQVVFNNLSHKQYGLVYKAFAPGTSIINTSFPDMQAKVWSYYSSVNIKRKYYDLPSRSALAYFYYMQGVEKVRQDDYVQAENYLELAFSIAGDQPLIVKIVANAYLEMKNFERGVDLARHGIAIFPFDADFYQMLAIISHRKNEFKQALEYYAQVLDLRKSDLQALTNRASIYEYLGSASADANMQKYYFELALADYRACLSEQAENDLFKDNFQRVQDIILSLDE